MVRKSDSVQLRNVKNGVFVIVDVGNIETALRNIGLYIVALKKCLGNFFPWEDLVGIYNRGEEKFYKPIAFVVSKQVLGGSEEQEEYMQWLEKKYQELEAVIVTPKTIKGSLVDCTDSYIISLICLALHSPKVHKIVIVSGDGDYTAPLEVFGAKGKKIEVIAAQGSVSYKLKHCVEKYGGKVNIIKGKIPGIMPISNNIERVIV